MEKSKISFSRIVVLVLLTFLIVNCGKKESNKEGSSDSKSENTNSENSIQESKKETTKSENGLSDSKKEASTLEFDANNIDGMIDEYQKLMDEYVRIVESVQSGKMSEMTKMQDFSIKISEWGKKFYEIAPKLTAEQQQRINKISEKTGGVVRKKRN